MIANIQLFDLLETVQDHSDDGEVANNMTSDLDLQLQRMLSLHSEISTTSSAATRHTEAFISESKLYRKIGAGACGAIFAQDGESIVIKLAKAMNSELWNDYLMHSTIQRELRITTRRTSEFHLAITLCLRWIPSTISSAGSSFRPLRKFAKYQRMHLSWSESYHSLSHYVCG